MKKVSIKDVAKEAGVSPTTVSYILNNNKNVSITPETRDRVLAAAEKLKYVPSQVAKTLGSSRVLGKTQSKMIGVVIPQTEDTTADAYIMLSNPFYSTFLSAVEFEMRQANYHVLVTGTNRGQSYIEVVKSRALDGVIIIGMYPSEDVEEYRRFNIPTVLVDCYGSSGEGFYSIRTDDRLGGYMATKYLLNMGHRSIAFVSGEIKEDGVNYMRYLGYLDALKEFGVKSDARLTFDGYVGFSYGAEAADAIARSNRRRKQKITAVFATSDITAIGLIKGLSENGLSVPDDISVMGFDDIDYAEMCVPGLTTVRQNIILKGHEAAKLIIKAMNGEEAASETIIPMQLVERSSVKKLEMYTEVT